MAEKYRCLLAFALGALAVGGASPSIGAPAHQLYGQMRRPPPIINVDASQEQKDVAFITNWVEHASKDSHPIVLAGKFANRLGLSSGQNIEGNGVSFQTEGPDAKEYFFIVLPGSKTVLLFKASDFIVYWLMDNGALELTAYEDSHRDLIVPNEKYREPYEKLIGIFLNRARQETSGAEPSSQAPKQ